MVAYGPVWLGIKSEPALKLSVGLDGRRQTAPRALPAKFSLSFGLRASLGEAGRCIEAGPGLSLHPYGVCRMTSKHKSIGNIHHAGRAEADLGQKGSPA